MSVGANVNAVEWMVGHASTAMTSIAERDLFDDDPDAEADRPDVVRGSAREFPASFRGLQQS